MRLGRSTRSRGTDAPVCRWVRAAAVGPAARSVGGRHPAAGRMSVGSRPARSGARAGRRYRSAVLFEPRRGAALLEGP
jgi:hypothetical protein